MPSEASLDEQIGAVELRLVEREAALRRRLREVAPRVQAALRPTRFVAPVLLVAVAAALIGRLLGPPRAGGRGTSSLATLLMAALPLLQRLLLHRLTTRRVPAPEAQRPAP